MDNEKEVLVQLGEQKIRIGKELIEKLNVFQHIPGVPKIQRKINTEILSLQKVMRLYIEIYNQVSSFTRLFFLMLQGISINRLTMNNILCSNLVYFEYFVNVLEKTENVYEVDVPIKGQNCQNTTVRIDIVADSGSTWIKVIARSSKALKDSALGRSNFGSKSILDHARAYQHAANHNLYCFKRPKVH